MIFVCLDYLFEREGEKKEGGEVGRIERKKMKNRNRKMEESHSGAGCFPGLHRG